MLDVQHKSLCDGAIAKFNRTVSGKRNNIQIYITFLLTVYSFKFMIKKQNKTEPFQDILIFVTLIKRTKC